MNDKSANRKGAYFWKEIAVANSSSAVFAQLTTVAALKNGGTGDTNQLDIVTTETGHEFVPKTPEAFSYDADGNLLSDGRWAYSWDAENRLVQIQSLANLPSSVPRQKLLFGYDYQGRRVSKVVSNYISGVWSAASNLRFVYDAWKLVAEFNGTNGLVRSYTWGLDLSGSMQGAGGIGGLLMVTQNTAQPTNQIVAYDGNGDAMALVDAGTGSNTTEYAYGPFGELLRATGRMAKANPFRFSTKYQDDESDLLYYGFRYFNPGVGRWLSRDPIEEEGGINLNAFVRNRPTSLTDPTGLDPWSAESFCDRALAMKVFIIVQAQIWNSASGPWSEDNQCSEQAANLIYYLESLRLRSFAGCCGGKKAYAGFSFKPVGGHHYFWPISADYSRKSLLT